MLQKQVWEPVTPEPHKYQRSGLSTIVGKAGAQALTVIHVLLANKSIYIGIVINDIREILEFFSLKPLTLKTATF